MRTALRNKFLKYKPEPAAMPFHTRLLGTDRLALYSFIHSLNTNFGTSVFEPVAVALAASNFADAKAQMKAGDYISAGACHDLLDIFERVGIELGGEIDEYFGKFNLK